MEEIVHLLAAKEHSEIAEFLNQRYDLEKDQNKRTALRVVAAQNYFYAAVNWIESFFAREKQHSFSHENRMSRIYENRPSFGEEIVDLYREVERDQRNKVAYRGENGPKYENLKKLSRLLREKYGKQVF